MSLSTGQSSMVVERKLFIECPCPAVSEFALPTRCRSGEYWSRLVTRYWLKQTVATVPSPWEWPLATGWHSADLSLIKESLGSGRKCSCNCRNRSGWSFRTRQFSSRRGVSDRPFGGNSRRPLTTVSGAIRRAGLRMDQRTRKGLGSRIRSADIAAGVSVFRRPPSLPSPFASQRGVRIGLHEFWHWPISWTSWFDPAR